MEVYVYPCWQGETSSFPAHFKAPRCHETFTRRTWRREGVAGSSHRMKKSSFIVHETGRILLRHFSRKSFAWFKRTRRERILEGKKERPPAPSISSQMDYRDRQEKGGLLSFSLAKSTHTHVLYPIFFHSLTHRFPGRKNTFHSFLFFLKKDEMQSQREG